MKTGNIEYNAAQKAMRAWLRAGCPLQGPIKEALDKALDEMPDLKEVRDLIINDLLEKQKQMLINEAVKIAKKALEESQENVFGLRLEETVLSEDEHFFFITLSHTKTTSLVSERQYKEVTVDRLGEHKPTIAERIA